MDAAIRGATERLVPIFMTALVTALGLLPLVVQSGEPGNEIEGPMATVILVGLITSTLLNLFVLPPWRCAMGDSRGQRRHFLDLNLFTYAKRAAGKAALFPLNPGSRFSPNPFFSLWFQMCSGCRQILQSARPDQRITPIWHWRGQMRRAHPGKNCCPVCPHSHNFC